MRIHIEHRNVDEKPWDWFVVECIDETKPDAPIMMSSASGNWEFINKIVSMWLVEYKLIDIK